jgi:hypothetical protein
VLRVLPAVKTKSDVGSPSAKTQTWPGVTVSGANNVPESAHPQVGFGHSCPVRSVHYSRCAATDLLSQLFDRVVKACCNGAIYDLDSDRNQSDIRRGVAPSTSVRYGSACPRRGISLILGEISLLLQRIFLLAIFFLLSRAVIGEINPL